jgi:hypothetical protein
MKLPRWLVVTLLASSALGVLGAAAWWWVAWPERTARELITLLDEGRFLETNRMLTDAHWERIANGSNEIELRPKNGVVAFAEARWRSCTRTYSPSGVILTKGNAATSKEEFAIVLHSRNVADIAVGRQVVRLKFPYRSSKGRIAVDFTVQRGTVTCDMLTDSD